MASKADICIVIGTSMVVYQAAGLVNYIPHGNPIYYVDPQPARFGGSYNFKHLQKKAGEGVPELVKELLEEGNDIRYPNND